MKKKLDLSMFTTNKPVSKEEFAQIEADANKKYISYFSNGKNKIHELVKFQIGEFEYVTTTEAYEILLNRKLIKASDLISKFKANVIFFESNQDTQIYVAQNIKKSKLKEFRDLGTSQYAIL
jgi:predicted transcriptional regulator